MSWFKKIARRIFDPGEKIVAAAIWANNKIYTGLSHMHALLKAMEDGALYRDEYGHLESPNGKKHLDLFVTNKNQIIDRLEADRYFGISASEDIPDQRLAIASLLRFSNKNKIIRTASDKRMSRSRVQFH